MSLNPDRVRVRCAEIEESVRRLEQVAALLHAVRSSYTESCHPEPFVCHPELKRRISHRTQGQLREESQDKLREGSQFAQRFSAGACPKRSVRFFGSATE